VIVFKKTPSHLRSYWKRSEKELEVKFSKRRRIQNGGSSILARELIFNRDFEEESHASPALPPREPEEDDAGEGVIEQDQEKEVATHATCGTNTSPEKRPYLAFVNPDSLEGAPGVVGYHSSAEHISKRRKKRCITCRKEDCIGLNNKKEDKCPEVRSLSHNY
jgi:hypothetical protein